MTSPPAHANLEHARGVPRAVRWVFPTPSVTPLRGQPVVGRDESCDTVLVGNEISRRHAEFRLDGAGAAVRDLQSRNGVHVNGSRRADAPLVPGDVIRCGEWIGVAVDAGEDDGFRELAPGWFGGAALAAAAEPVRQVSPARPITIHGETGAGKEALARAIHVWSDRPGPFVPVACGSLAGEFPAGALRAAAGGSLFLDDVLQLLPEVQQVLSRLLEHPRDVIIFVATVDPIADAVAGGRFRGDLERQLAGVTVVLPPLRARREDIIPLFQEFLRRQCGGEPPVPEPRLAEALCLHDWPLNLRELALLAAHLLGAQGGEPVLRKSFLPEAMRRRDQLTPAAP